jgi:hypothetical protein
LHYISVTETANQLLLRQVPSNPSTALGVFVSPRTNL